MSEPNISEERCLVAKGQTWQADDGRLMFGPDLLDRAYRRGWADEQFFIDSSVGTVLKTGVSVWERTREQNAPRGGSTPGGQAPTHLEVETMNSVSSPPVSGKAAKRPPLIVCWETMFGEQRVGQYLGPVETSGTARRIAVRSYNGIVHVTFNNLTGPSQRAVDRELRHKGAA